MLFVDLANGCSQPFLGDHLLLLDLAPLQQELLRMEHLVRQLVLHPAHLAHRTGVLQFVPGFGGNVRFGAYSEAHLRHLLSLLVSSHSEIRNFEVPIIQLREL